MLILWRDCGASVCHRGPWRCRFETQEEVEPGKMKTVRQDIRSLVLAECQYQFVLGKNAKATINSEVDDDPSAEPPLPVERL